MKGQMGYCPDWVKYFTVGREFHVSPVEVSEWPAWWIDKALILITAESQSAKIREQLDKFERK